MKLAALLGNDTLKQRLSALQAKGKLTHSFLLTGPEGSGRHTLARILCAAMQCTAPGERPCGVCPQCRKVLDGAHPDICIVDDPEKKTIPVKLVRDACTDLYIRPNEGQRKIYLFPRAQDLNQQGQNVLLKSIEEPPPYGTFLLLAEHAEQLLPTIRSRCVELRLSPLPEAVLLPAHAGGYLGRAESILRDDAGLLPQSAAFVRAYCARRPEELLQVLAPMERLKREQLRPILTQWQALLVSALTSRSGLPPLRPECAQIAEARPVSDITQAIEAIRLALRDLEGNVSPGAICGALTVKLR